VGPLTHEKRNKSHRLPRGQRRGKKGGSVTVSEKTMMQRKTEIPMAGGESRDQGANEKVRNRGGGGRIHGKQKQRPLSVNGKNSEQSKKESKTFSKRGRCQMKERKGEGINALGKGLMGKDSVDDQRGVIQPKKLKTMGGTANGRHPKRGAVTVNGKRESSGRNGGRRIRRRQSLVGKKEEAKKWEKKKQERTNSRGLGGIFGTRGYG